MNEKQQTAMKPKRGFWLTDIRCRIFGHDYKLKRKITPYLREIECKNCKRQFAMHDELRCVLPLDDELRACNNDLVYNR